MDIEFYKNQIKNWKKDSLLDKIMYVFTSIILYSAFIFFIVFFNNLSKLSDVEWCGSIAYIIILLFSCHYVIKMNKVNDRNELYDGYMKALEEKEESIKHEKEDLVNERKTLVQKKLDTDNYCIKKRSEADNFMAGAVLKIRQEKENKKQEIQEQLIQKQLEIDAARLEKKQDIDDYKEKTIKEISDYKKQKEAEVSAWMLGSDTITNIRREELAYYEKIYGTNDKDHLVAMLRKEIPFSYSANMISDIKAVLFENVEKLLRFKKQPAILASEEVSEIKRKFRKTYSEYRQMLYKYEFLLKTFPELSKYVEDEKGILTLANTRSYDDFLDNYDRVKDYLSQEEYRQLSETERNQLALDNYNRRPKSNWQIGAEYEMYCAYILEEKGFKTIDYGIKKRFEDLGRDIIAKKDGLTYIIQCKRWAADREIHENVICQLFGTTIEYNIRTQQERNNPTLFDDDMEIIPVLMTTAELSETSKVFANKLNVKVDRVNMGKYPQIKCNIGNDGEKIYHLPFDQQYYKTKIDKHRGEKYAWTVQEAEEAGFRRAYRWSGN